DRDTPVVFVGRDDADALVGAELAQAVAVTNIAGRLAGGMTSWREERRPVAHTERMTVPELHERWAREGGASVQILDVRERTEWDTGHIPGSLHVPYHDLHAMPEGLDPARTIAAICASGQRSAVAASLLQRDGAADVVHVVDGGVGTWAAAGWPVEN